MQNSVDEDAVDGRDAPVVLKANRIKCLQGRIQETAIQSLSRFRRSGIFLYSEVEVVVSLVEELWCVCVLSFSW